MDYVKPVDFKQLKAFFLALQQSRFNLKQISTIVVMDGVRTPVDKAHCLKLLRSFSDLSGEEFKDDNFLIKYLSQPGNIKRILGRLTPEQQIELTKVLEEKPTAVVVAGEQLGGGETSAEQGVPAQAPVDTAANTMGVPGLPSTPSISSTPRLTRVIHNIPHAPAEEAAKEKLVIANKSGVGERPITPVSAPQRFNFSSFKSSFSSTFGKMQNFTSRAGVFFQRNVGKFFTVGRIGTAVSAGIGAVAGAGFGPIGALAGAGAGGLGSLWIRSGDGARFLGRMGNGAINAGVRFSNQVAYGGTRLSVSSGSKKMVWGLLLGFFFLVLGVGLIGGLAGTTPSGEAAPVSSFPNANLSSCTFTRAGNSFSIKSSKLVGWISDTAVKVGVPTQVLASVAMHENPGFVVNKDDNSEEIKTNTFCNKGPVFCEKSGQVLHSKAYTTGEDDPCAPEEIADGARTAQAVGLMQILDIYNPGKDLCSITESLTIAAEKLKASGLTQQPTQQQITIAIERYHNGCSYGSFSYCDEVWKDVQSCQPSSFAGGGLVPTGQGGERIANMSKQIASQLIHSTKAEDTAKRAELVALGIPCEPGGIAGPSYHCWIQSPKYNQIPKDEGYVQCTEFVWATFAEAGYSTQIDKIRRNDAYNWPDEALKYPDTFIVFNDPTQLQPGDIISLGLGSGGIAQHIAVVVDKTENTVQVAQASTAQPTETYNILNGKLQIINPTNARCTPDTNPGCRISFIRLK